MSRPGGARMRVRWQRDLVQRARAGLGDGLLAAQFWSRSGMARELRPGGLGALARGVRDLGVGPHLAVVVHAANHPDKEAVIAGARRVSYADLDRDANRLARGLLALGASSGDRIAVMLPNGVEQLLAQEALPRAGLTIVQIGTRLVASEVAHILGNAEPQVLLYHASFRERIAEARAMSGGPDEEQLVIVGAGDEDVGGEHHYEELLAEQARAAPLRRGGGGGGVIVYTSGTTGLPKGATRSWRDTGITAVTDLLHQVGARTDERHLVVCPLYHSGALAFAKMILGIGATVVVEDHFDAEAVLATIERERITSAFFVPTMLVRLCAEPSLGRYDTSSLRWVVSGAAPLPTDVARRFQGAFGPLLWNFYGATETGLVTLAGPADHIERPGTVGRALRGNELRIFDDDGEEVGPDEVGELYAHNAQLIAGYHKNADATRASQRGGFFSVGDLARLDEDGYLYLESRVHDMVISGGVNIYPREIEDHLHAHPAVLEAAVIGVPDLEWGESLVAFVVPRQGTAPTADELFLHCREGLAGYKCPRRVVFVGELPRNPTGKVLKRALQASATGER